MGIRTIATREEFLTTLGNIKTLTTQLENEIAALIYFVKISENYGYQKRKALKRAHRQANLPQVHETSRRQACGVLSAKRKNL